MIELNHEELRAILKTKCQAIADTVASYPSSSEQWKVVRSDLTRLLELIKDQ